MLSVTHYALLLSPIQIGNAAGLGFPEWFDAGKVSIENGAIGFPAVKASFGEQQLLELAVQQSNSTTVCQR